MSRLKVRDLMTENVVTIRGDATLREAAHQMLFTGVSGLPVLDPQGKIVGVVTEGDLLRTEAHEPVRRGFLAQLASLGARETLNRTVDRIMTRDVLTARPDEELRAAARRMARAGVKRLPVVDDGRLVGILSRHDIIEVFDRRDLELQRAVRRFLEENGFVPPDADIKVHVDDGVVALTGTVLFESDMRVAEALAASMDGVIGVMNHLGFRKTDLHLRSYGYA